MRKALSVCAILLFVAGCEPSANYNERTRRDYAHAARACALKLSVAPGIADSLRILEGTSWTPGCARSMTYDTLPQ